MIVRALHRSAVPWQARLGLILSLAMLWPLLPATSAHATHEFVTEFTMNHTPPPYGVAGRDLTFTAIIHTNCEDQDYFFGVNCDPVKLTVNYTTPLGVIRSLTATGTEDRDQTITATISGADLTSGTLRYDLVASQTDCSLFSCAHPGHSPFASTRFPAQGQQEVSIRPNSWGTTMAINHVQPALAIAGQDLPLHAEVTSTCVRHVNCPMEYTFKLSYWTPWGTTESAYQVIDNFDFGNDEDNEAEADFTVPADAVRALYQSPTDLPRFRYWLEVFDGAQGCEPSACDSYARSPVAGGTHTVPVIHRFSGTTTSPTGTPWGGGGWQLLVYDLETSVPTIFAQGTVPASGQLVIDVPITQAVLDAAGENGGYANVTLRVICFDLLDGQCFDVPTEHVPNDPAATIYQYEEDLYMNVEDAAAGVEVPGIQKYDPTGQLEFVYYEPKEDGGGGGYGQCTCSETCSETLAVDDRVIKVAELHHDYGLRASYTYGGTNNNQADSTITTGINFGQNGWSIGGYQKVSNTSEAERGYSYPDTSGTGVTAVSLHVVHRFAHLNETIVHREPDGDVRCVQQQKVVPRGWRWQEDMTSSTPWIATGDRCFQSCTPNGDEHAIIQHDPAGGAKHFGVTKGKSQEYGLNTDLWGFNIGYSWSGYSTFSRMNWDTIRQCPYDWRIYYDGALLPGANAPKAFVDAGASGAAHTDGIPNGCTSQVID